MKDEPSTEELDEIGEVEEIEIDADSEEESLLERLKSRCRDASIEVRETEYEEGQIFTSVLLPSGREKRSIPTSGDRAENLLNIEFEKFVFLRGLEAICSYRDQYIEVGIRGLPTPMFLTRQLDALIAADPESEGLVLEHPADSQAPKVVIGYASDEFATLSGQRGRLARVISLKVIGGGFTGHDDASLLLRKLANSIAFKMELEHGSGFTLRQERLRRYIPRRKRPSAFDEVTYPSHEYEGSPISLYWYARDARGLPLLRFLALYQCIEFFFPTYAESEAKRRVSLILKDPVFRTDRDSDLARILNAVRLGRSGFGNEKAQLKSVIDECVDPNELREFIEGDSGLADHVQNKNSKLKFHKLPVANVDLDLRNDLANRVYDIRCKIVHTKDESSHQERGMILPDSDEANSLEYDNVLMEFLAQRVLITSSVPLRFHS